MTGNMICDMMMQITLAFDETTTLGDIDELFQIFGGDKPVSESASRK